MHDYDEDIIAAIATGYTTSAIGIIRVSGRGSFELLEKIFSKTPPYKHSHLHYGNIIDERQQVIDEVLVSTFFGPKSYTGEDLFEINCHGGLVVENMILKRLLQAGARGAKPGEFTKRAFLNGKLDLSQVEAVEKVISSKSERALRIAQRQLSGKFSSKLDNIRDRILFLMAENEVIIDHPEEDLTNTSSVDKIKSINSIAKELKSILRASEFGNSIFEGVVMALVGKPNVGKSSLLNLLIGSERSIVTDIPGTTRDVVSDSFNINGIPFTILDTAGIRKAENVVESMGIDRSKEAIKNSDIVVALFDASIGLDDEDFEIIDILRKSNKPVIGVINKIDVASKIKTDELDFGCLVEMSCKSGFGLKTLEQELSDMVLHDVDDADIISLNAEQQSYLVNAIKICYKLKDDLVNNIDPALFAIDLLSLTDYLDEIIGRVTNEDMLDVMFKNFCIGK